MNVTQKVVDLLLTDLNDLSIIPKGLRQDVASVTYNAFLTVADFLFRNTTNPIDLQSELALLASQNSPKTLSQTTDNTSDVSVSESNNGLLLVKTAPARLVVVTVTEFNEALKSKMQDFIDGQTFQVNSAKNFILSANTHSDTVSQTDQEFQSLVLAITAEFTGSAEYTLKLKIFSNSKRDTQYNLKDFALAIKAVEEENATLIEGQYDDYGLTFVGLQADSMYQFQSTTGSPIPSKLLPVRPNLESYS